MNGKPLIAKYLTAIFLIAGIVSIVAAAFPDYSGMANYEWICPSLGVFSTAILLIIGIFQLVTSYAVYVRESYAGDLAILFSILGLFAYPLGTLLSVFAIFGLLTKDARTYLS